MNPGEFVLDLAAIGRVLNEAPAIRKLEDLAGQVVISAQQGPRGRGPRHEVDFIAVGDTRQTAEGAEVDIDWHSSIWHIIEMGSVNNPPYRPITRAAQNAGLRIIDKK